MNNTKLLQHLVILLVLAVFTACKQEDSPKNLVHSVEEFNKAVAQAKPGTVITLANGVWQNAELLLEGNGTQENPITLTVEEKGKVTLEGQSNLRMAGTYLHVEGLVFKNGYTPTTEVISFKKDKNNLAHYSRLTECVIDNYNNPERHEPDTWVAIYGKHNRIDHNHLAGKRNRGVTMIVRLNTEESQQNENHIDHNYFGPRQNLGSNGGETLRIGTSHYSLKDSKTVVASNYFDRCNGEHEIISNKSGKNIYKDNVFYECTGTLTMRHGSGTQVLGNVFIGNNKPSTGGIRVINGQQTVKNNYGVGLTGYRFRGAFVIMNGVPNSPINRYHQVEDAIVTNNTFVDCDHIQLCAGSDAERSAVPVNSVMENNVFYTTDKKNLFTVYDDINGITFKNNIISPYTTPLTENGFIQEELELKANSDGLVMPVGLPEGIGASLSKDLATKDNTGVNWYAKKELDVTLNSGNTITVDPGLNSLVEAVNTANAGDILQLEAGGAYPNTKTIIIDKPITITGAKNNKPKLFFEKKSLLQINNGGSLSLSHLVFDGADSPDRTGNSVITTSKYSMNKNYKLFIEDCEFVNLDVNHSYDAIRVYKNTFADTISIKDSNFKNITGHIMALDRETDDIGIYNAEYVILKNNSFTDIGGAALRLHRGGKDESTFGPFLEMEHNVLDNVGYDKRNKYEAAVSLYGVQVVTIANNIFTKTEGINTHLVVGEPIVNVVNNAFYASDKLTVTGDQNYNAANLWELEPRFKDKTYSLESNSPLKGKGTDGKDLGLLK
ncbi:polysaccharide lyase 6 family protein [Croceivirga radicis]|uniref:polysaccharide lyase 6 family protein n=1 Tax=Croceivirga radicis TaxID=1929488 RepID=UPI000255B36D|nr:polysaccharide lyase 6 family protein [Croceivirga radicis]